MTKTRAIRESVKGIEWAMTNKQVKDDVLRRFNLVVSTNEVINAIGSYHQRRQSQGVNQILLEKARDYLAAVDDPHLARNLLLKVVPE